MFLPFANGQEPIAILAEQLFCLKSATSSLLQAVLVLSSAILVACSVRRSLEWVYSRVMRCSSLQQPNQFWKLAGQDLKLDLLSTETALQESGTEQAVVGLLEQYGKLIEQD